jgi:hypothetical protein
MYFEATSRQRHRDPGLGIAIPGQFPNLGIRDWRGRDPGAQCNVIRASNPGPTLSIPGFGIETFLMPESRREYVTTQYHNTTTCESYSPQFPHRWVRCLCVGWYCSILDAKQTRKKLNNVRKKCNGSRAVFKGGGVYGFKPPPPRNSGKKFFSTRKYAILLTCSYTDFTYL